MEETTLKQILDVVVDIKTEQTEMKQTMNKMEQRLDKIEGRLDNVETEQKEMKQVLDNVVKEQKIMKRVQNEMYHDIKYLMEEQFDTKNIVIELVNKVGEMDSNTKKAKIYQFPKR